jgi:hypothetical protein
MKRNFNTVQRFQNGKSFHKNKLNPEHHLFQDSPNGILKTISAHYALNLTGGQIFVHKDQRPRPTFFARREGIRS